MTAASALIAHSAGIACGPLHAPPGAAGLVSQFPRAPAAADTFGALPYETAASPQAMFAHGNGSKAPLVSRVVPMPVLYRPCVDELMMVVAPAPEDPSTRRTAARE